MRRLWLTLCLLLLLFAGTLANSRAIGQITGQMNSLLLQAEEQGRAENWAGAEALTRQALAQWEAHADYLYAVLRHADVDEVNTRFQEALAFLASRDGSEYASSNAQLTARLRLLAEMERLNWKNLL